MELSINLTTCDTCNDCKVTIQDNSTYLSEDYIGTVKGKFKLSDTVSIDVLRLNKSDEIEYLNPTIVQHYSLQPTTLQISNDGWYSLVHIVLPSEEWFNRELAKQEGSALGLYPIVYFANENKIYKYINQQIQEVHISEIVEVNPIETTLSKTSKDFISICFLRKCYINLCQQILNGRGFSSCWKDNKIDNELIYKRDLIWMAINVIKYLTECEQLAEAERIIETINGCNGLCSSTSSQYNNGCGCSK